MLRGIVGLLVAGLLLWLVFRGTDWNELVGALREVRLAWLGAAQLLLWGGILARVQRWTYVVRAVHPASYRSLLAASQIGMLVNFSVPARLGELVRAWVLSRLATIPLARSLAMVTLDRVNDVIGLLAVLFLAALGLAGDVDVELPPGSFGNREALVVSSRLVQPVAWTLAGAVLAGALLLVVLYVRREPVLRVLRAALAPVSSGLAERIAHLLGSFAEGLHVFRSRRDLARAIAWSLLGWGADLAGLAAIFLAFGLEFPWYAPCVTLSFVAVALLVPLTPGTVGQFHLPAVAGLLLAAPDVEPARAKAVAIVDHLSTLVPVIALGLYCLLRERLGLLEVVRRSLGREGVPVVGAGPGG
jgi:uncharacterized protein (TIRG00374 family)